MNSILKKISVGIGVLILFYLFIVSPIIMFVWSEEPDIFDVQQVTQKMSDVSGNKIVSGSYIMATTIKMNEILLNKRGGYLSNDIMFPSIIMDNVPNWEFGVIEIERVVALTLRKDFSRSQSQSIELKSLINAQTALNNNHNKWMLPSTESKYKEAEKGFNEYMNDISDESKTDIQFYSRADNLANLLSELSSKLGSMSQRLSASTFQGTVRENTDLANDETAKQSTKTANKIYEKTDWSKIDDVFYEARGQSWAMLHVLKAIKHDFNDVLSKKNAHPSLNQIIKELEDTQEPFNSLFIMNGKGFGMFANHSLVMANYISRANAAIINMVELLNKG